VACVALESIGVPYRKKGVPDAHFSAGRSLDLSGVAVDAQNLARRGDQLRDDDRNVAAG
jgi:hypothetical protein